MERLSTIVRAREYCHGCYAVCYCNSCEQIAGEILSNRVTAAILGHTCVRMRASSLQPKRPSTSRDAAQGTKLRQIFPPCFCFNKRTVFLLFNSTTNRSCGCLPRFTLRRRSCWKSNGALQPHGHTVSDSLLAGLWLVIEAILTHHMLKCHPNLTNQTIARDPLQEIRR